MGTGIKIEVLYGEFANLFGELQNVNYLKSCIPDAEVIYTGLHDKPAFADGGADFGFHDREPAGVGDRSINAV